MPTALDPGAPAAPPAGARAPSDDADGAAADAAPPRRADAVTQATRAIALSSLAGLIALGLAWELWLAPTGSGTLALKVLPLLPALAGVWRHRMYTYRWLSLLVWLYFTEGVVRATSESGMSAALAAAEIALSLLLFAACALHVRWRLRRGAARATPST
ncbi:MAG: DUF2069 domain-containing protein [Burkholderiales bacterium]|nr:DUF2069 domain-containing protein [Burkholderiales bacterium]